MPLFWISLAFLCGIILSSSISLPLLGWLVPAFLALILLFPPIYRGIKPRLFAPISQFSEAIRIPYFAVYPLMILFFALGAIRYQYALPRITPSLIAYYNDQSTEYIIEGVVMDAPDVRDTYINLHLHIDQLRPAGTSAFIPVKGDLLARVFRSTGFGYGDRIHLQGKLETPPENEDFSYRDYLANRGIYSYMVYPASSLIAHGQGNPFYSVLYTFRQHAIDQVYSFYPDPEASLMSGIILGVQSGISANLQEAFRLTGTSHIIVISGFNITIVAGMFTLVFSRLLGRYKGAIVAAIGIILYTLLVGANAAVVRAAVLGLLGLLGHVIGRRQAGVNSLTFVAGIMAARTPTVLWDVSFQLSFAATLGIMLYAEPMTEWFILTASRLMPEDKAKQLAGPVSAYLLLTLAAQLTTLPLMAYYFKRISLTALIANPLILPAQPALMVLGGLSALAGVIFKPVGQLFAWAAWPFTAYTIRMVEWLARVPHGSIALGRIALPLLSIFYLARFAITFARLQIPSLIKKLTPAVPLSIMAIVTVLVWRAALYAPDGKMHVTILDVGTGDAVLIQSPAGRAVLVNGGSSTIALSDTLGRRLPPFNRSLDWLVVADIDSEDLSGISNNLERFRPANALWAGNTNGNHSAADLWTGLISNRIQITPMAGGQKLDLGSGVLLQVLSTNPKGAVLLLEWQNFRMLLPMGMDFDSLKELTHNSAMRNISAVLLAESGYAPLNPPELIELLHPQLAVLSVAAADKTGLPSPETMEALKGYNLLRTDLNGWIEITTDGSQVWVAVERK